jgi:hypothetical protein
MEKLAENDITYFYLRHVVIVVTADRRNCSYDDQFTASDILLTAIQSCKSMKFFFFLALLY